MESPKSFVIVLFTIISRICLVLDLVTSVDPVRIDVYRLAENVCPALMALSAHLAGELADRELLVSKVNVKIETGGERVVLTS